MRRSIACAALIGVTATGAWAAGHRVSHSAKADDVAGYLSLCKTDADGCATRVVEAQAAFRITQSFFHDPGYCIPASDDHGNILAPKVVVWLTSHPAHTKDPIYTGINAALTDLYPCGTAN